MKCQKWSMVSFSWSQTKAFSLNVWIYALASFVRERRFQRVSHAQGWGIFIDQGPFLAHFDDGSWLTITHASIILTWLPNTPMEQAEDTWSGPNHTAATFGETPKRKTWAVADNSWPINATLKPSRDTLKTLIHAPAVVPIDPRSKVTRRPFGD